MANAIALRAKLAEQHVTSLEQVDCADSVRKLLIDKALRAKKLARL
jgi:hypothetical protein